MSNKGISVIIMLLSISTVLFAQKMGDGPASIDPFEGRDVRSSFQKIQVGTSNNMVGLLSEYLSTETNFNSDEVSVELIAHTSSTVSEHYLFKQMYRGYEVFNGDIKLNMDTKGTIRSVFDNSYNTADWDGNSLTAEASALAQVNITEGLKNKLGYPNASLETEVVIAEIYGKPFALKKVTLTNNGTNTYHQYLVDAQLNIIYSHDLSSYSGGTEATATAKVFMPDPTVSAGVYYGSPYIDSNNLEVAVLNDQRQSVVIPVDFDGTYYYLESDYVKLDEFSAPVTVNATPITPNFDHTRGQDQFEEVNAYYHLVTFNNYIRDSLAMILGDFQVRFDAHGLNGQDNSMYNRSGGIPSLFFGDGQVDDAEDADVVVHEYGHALSDQAAPNTNRGFERTSLDEGVGDYICSSYSRSITEFRWDDVFSWDGHNEFWDGRTSTTGQIYDADNLASSIHTNGEMWATALMQIWEAIGKINSDKLALQTLYSFSSQMTFPDAALAYEDADSLLFGGANYDVIHPIFVARGFFPGEVGINEVSKQERPTVTIANTDGFAFNNEALMVISNKPIKSIELYDLTGKLIDKQLVNNSFVTNYAAQLRSGVYILNVVTTNGNATHKLVKGN